MPYFKHAYFKINCKIAAASENPLLSYGWPLSTEKRQKNIYNNGKKTKK